MCFQENLLGTCCPLCLGLAATNTTRLPAPPHPIVPPGPGPPPPTTHPALSAAESQRKSKGDRDSLKGVSPTSTFPARPMTNEEKYICTRCNAQEWISEIETQGLQNVPKQKWAQLKKKQLMQ